MGTLLCLILYMNVASFDKTILSSSVKTLVFIYSFFIPSGKCLYYSVGVVVNIMYLSTFKSLWYIYACSP